jgi:hypothetical protein
MKQHRRVVSFVGALALIALPSTASLVNAQGTTDAQFSGGVLTEPKSDAAQRIPMPRHNPAIPYRCASRVLQKTDVAFEGVKRTASNWSNPANGGGETGRFDRVPVLTTRVVLRGGCLNAHLSAMVGSKKSYGGVSAITMFQVTLTPPGAANHRHMIGHYDTPYGIYGPAVALEAENDVDMYASNFFQPVGTGPTDVPPGVYTVDVWWAGGPVGGGGAIGAAFVLSLYQM